MSELAITVCRVRTPEGMKDYVTVLPLEQMLKTGLSPQSIVGVLTAPLGQGERITPTNFVRNRVFVDFLHAVIARAAPEQPGLQAEARRLGNGWVYVFDARTRTPGGPVPPHDIVGAFEVKDGAVVPGSYQPNANHRILSEDGFFRLEPGLQQALLRELAALPPVAPDTP